MNDQDNFQNAAVNWMEECALSIIVSDPSGKILYMNTVAADAYLHLGGKLLIGSSMFECHPEPALTKLKELMDQRHSNVYTIEKNGIHKMVLQSPWVQDGTYAGYIELIFPIPVEIPHYIRGTNRD